MFSSSATSGGLAFVLQNDGTGSLGSTAYGYGGLKNSLAVILDAVDNEVLIETGGNTSSIVGDRRPDERATRLHPHERHALHDQDHVSPLEQRRAR